MAGRLQDLRRAAGYSSAREFAESLGIPPTTYARYESSPGRIPLRVAWSLADRLGVTIDEIVGRDAGAAYDPRGDDQRAIDALSEESRADAREYLRFLVWRDERDDAAREARSGRRWALACAGLESAFLAGLEEAGDPDGLLTAADERVRTAFESRVAAYARAHGWGEGAVGMVMREWDRAHGAVLRGVPAPDNKGGNKMSDRGTKGGDAME